MRKTDKDRVMNDNARCCIPRSFSPQPQLNFPFFSDLKAALGLRCGDADFDIGRLIVTF